MANQNHRLIVGTVILQGVMFATLVLIFFLILPGQGFVVLRDFNSAEKVASQDFWMDFIRWSDVIFAASMLVILNALYQRHPLSPLLRVSRIILFGVVIWFILHDIGFHIISWAAIENDPASTDYAMDRALWGIRNTIFFVVGLLTVLSARHSSSSPASR